MYGTLCRLFGEGLLSCYVVPSEEGPNRKYHGLTTTGHKALEEQRHGWTSFAATVDGILDGTGLDGDFGA